MTNVKDFAQPQAKIIINYPVGQPAGFIVKTMEEAETLFNDAIDDWKSEDYFTISFDDVTTVWRSSDVIGIALLDLRPK